MNANERKEFFFCNESHYMTESVNIKELLLTQKAGTDMSI